MQRATMSPSVKSKPYKKTREGGRDYLQYDGYKYRFSNPLSVKGGKNWCCANTKCRGSLKTEMSFGDLILIPGREHSHPKTLFKRQSTTGKNDNNENGPLNDTLPSDKSLTLPSVASQKHKPIDSSPQNHTPLHNFNNTGSILLPQSYSVQSMGLTPNLSSNSPTDCTYNETPQSTTQTADLKTQVNGLIQVIINKEMEINTLQAKSDADEKLLAELMEHITDLETENTNKNVKINSLEYQISLRDACSCGPAPRSEYLGVLPRNSTAVSPTPLIAPSHIAQDEWPSYPDTDNAITRKKRNKRRRGKGRVSTSSKQELLPTEMHNDTRKRPKAKVLLISDSMLRDVGQVLSSVLPYSTVSSVIYPNATFDNVIHSLSELSKGYTKQDYVIIMGGTNNIHNLEPNTSAHINLSPIYEINKFTNIILCSIPYRYDTWAFLNSNIYNTNTILYQKCRQNRISFISCNTFLQSQHFTLQGLHLNKHGKKVLSHKIKSFVLTDLLSNVFTPMGPVPTPLTPLDASSTIVPDLIDLTETGKESIMDISCPLSTTLDSTFGNIYPRLRDTDNLRIEKENSISNSNSFFLDCSPP
uniref:FLYWCH-type domain-containing protein n=1 Tax=Cacopsylla melanoneura TaxID=428564 RepID=A0A8D8T3Y6_9HEMI